MDEPSEESDSEAEIADFDGAQIVAGALAFLRETHLGNGAFGGRPFGK
jgi:hypothetical protein